LPFFLFAQAPIESYPVDSASVVHPGVPKGEVLHFTFEKSKIFPGTFRDYWVYIPAQYNPSKPACVFIDQDNIQFKAPVVFDNLINSKEMPVTIGIFITPGRVKASDTTALDRFNRSLEYDGLGDAYTRFLLEEILPEVEKHKTGDGRAIILSKKANDRSIGGGSSGAICVFTAAWEHPEAFSRVFSSIGTYVSLRGGDRYPGLIRKYEPKPIRIFLQDGTNDLNIYGGDWHLANLTMESALTFSGYEVAHEWGTGAHNDTHATAIFPRAMRWLWKDYPKPVAAGVSKNPFLMDILVPGEGWELVGKGQEPISLKAKANGKGNGVLTGSIKNGNWYFSGKDGTPDAGKIFMVNKKSGKKTVVDKGLNNPYGLALTPDKSQLYVTESNSHWVWLYNIKQDGTLINKQRYGWLHQPDVADNAHPTGIQCDRNGRVYVATNMGIQVLDQAGRVNAILDLPYADAQINALCFGGKDFNELYVSIKGNVYRRKLKVKGANANETAIKPVAPKL